MKLKSVFNLAIVSLMAFAFIFLIYECSSVRSIDAQQSSIPQKIMKYLLNSREAYGNKFLRRGQE